MTLFMTCKNYLADAKSGVSTTASPDTASTAGAASGAASTAGALGSHGSPLPST